MRVHMHTQLHKLHTHTHTHTIQTHIFPLAGMERVGSRGCEEKGVK